MNCAHDADCNGIEGKTWNVSQLSNVECVCLCCLDQVTISICSEAVTAHSNSFQLLHYTSELRWSNPWPTQWQLGFTVWPPREWAHLSQAIILEVPCSCLGNIGPLPRQNGLGVVLGPIPKFNLPLLISRSKATPGWMINWRWSHPGEGMASHWILPAMGGYPARQYLTELTAVANCMKWAHRAKTLCQSELLLTRGCDLKTTLGSVWYVGRRELRILSLSRREVEKRCAPSGSCHFFNYREACQIRKIVRGRL
jgi:hypothetical protein